MYSSLAQLGKWPVSGGQKKKNKKRFQIGDIHPRLLPNVSAILPTVSETVLRVCFQKLQLPEILSRAVMPQTVAASHMSLYKFKVTKTRNFVLLLQPHFTCLITMCS